MTDTPIPPNKPSTAIRPSIDFNSNAMLEEVITMLKKSGASIDSETLLLVMVKNLLARIAKETGLEIDINNLTEGQEKQLEEALMRITEQLQQAGLIGDAANIRKLLRILVKSRNTEKEKERDENGQEEDTYESLSPKEKKRLQQLIKLFAIYEAYKATNPNQLAGETSQVNFINNLHLHGKDFAIHKAGSDMGLNEKEIKALEKNSKSFVEGLTNFNSGKDTGWSR